MASKDVLMEQLPYYFRPIIEYQEIMKAHGYALDNLDGNVIQVNANNYISTADESTIAFWESVLGLSYKFGDTLEFRRARVLQKFTTVPPFSIGFLREKLNEMFGEDGYELSVDPVACTLKIKVTSDRYGAIDLLYSLLWDVVPAHIQINANKEVTTYSNARLNVGGITSVTMIRNIYYENVIDIKSEIATVGAVSHTAIITT